MIRFIRYWYTYRIFVAVLLAIVISGVMNQLYAWQIQGDAGQPVPLNVSVHPEDRIMSALSTDTSQYVELVGIDDKTLQAEKRFPLPRGDYATVLQNLEGAGASVVAFDIGFSDFSNDTQDRLFSNALKDAKIPVVLAYGGSLTVPSTGKYVQRGPDQIPIKEFRCADADQASITCSQPFANVYLGSTDIAPDSDGVLRRMPMFVQPKCYGDGTCDTSLLNPLGFAAYSAFEGTNGKTLTQSNGEAQFGWSQGLAVDDSGRAIINYSGAPGNYELHNQYVSFTDVLHGNFSHDAVNGRIILIGAYNLTGVNDSVLTPTSSGARGELMAGIEVHANMVQTLLTAPVRFLQPEPAIAVLLVLLVSSLLMALAISRLTVIWGFVLTVGAIVTVFFAGAAAQDEFNVVPDLFHPWLDVGLVYAGVTAYRFLYEDRERRKVTSLFGQYLKPEIVAQLAQQRGGVDDIMRGGERRDITLLFVDVRGFTSMSEKMAAEDVTNVIQLYLDHLSGIIFTWDGTIDKYVGDEIVAFWNAPRNQPDHALLAVRCAYDMIAKAPELNRRLVEKSLPPIRWGIGVNTGPAVVGNMGSQSRLQYTALGDTVNTAARFCANAPAFHLLIGQPTYDACKDYIAVDMVPGVQLKGKSAETFRIYQVTAIRENASAPWVQFPTDMASEAHAQFTQQYTQKTILAAGNLGSRDILIGTEAEQAMAGQAAGPPREE